MNTKKEKRGDISFGTVIKIILAVATVVVVFLIVYAISGKAPEALSNLPFFS